MDALKYHTKLITFLIESCHVRIDPIQQVFFKYKSQLQRIVICSRILVHDEVPLVLHVIGISRKREEDAKKRLLENPVKMKQLQKNVIFVYYLFYIIDHFKHNIMIQNIGYK